MGIVPSLLGQRKFSASETLTIVSEVRELVTVIITKLHTSYFILTVSSKPTDLGRPRAPLYLSNYSSGPWRRKRERFTSIFLSVSLSEFKTICHFDHFSFAQGQLSPISHQHQSIQNDGGDILGQ